MSRDIRETSSQAADEGTAAHILAEHCLRTGADADHFDGAIVDIETGVVSKSSRGRSFTVDFDMSSAVQVFLDTVRGLVSEQDDVEYEVKLDLSHVPGMEYGTGDVVAYRPDDRELLIVDYKHGRGVPVEVDDNPQLLTYALGAAWRFHNLGVDTVRIVIVQPRCPHPDGPVRTSRIDMVDLVEFQVQLEAAAKATAAEDAPLRAGSWCKFCPAAGVCPAQRDRALAVAHMEFGGQPSKDVVELSPDEMAAVLRDLDIVKSWIKRAEERAHKCAMEGNPPTGFKLVASRATRRWRDDALDGLKGMGASEEDIFAEPAMRSPAQVEARIGKSAALDDLIEKRSSGTILVPEKDPRRAVRVSAESEFGEHA